MFPKRRRHAVFAALALTLASVTAGSGKAADRDDVCDSQALAKAHNPYAYRWYAAEETCEGLYDKPRRRQLDLISLTRGKLRFDLDSKDVEIHAPTGPLLDGRSIRVRGFGLEPTMLVDGQTLAYQLDSALVAGGSRSWPMERVLKPRQLEASKIGLVAWLEGDAGPIYVPVEVRQGSAAAQPRAPILITVRVPGYAEWVKACLQPVQTIDLDAGKAVEVPSCKWEQFASGTSAGGTVDIPLPPGPEGLLSVAVSAKVGTRVYPLHEDVYRPAGW